MNKHELICLFTSLKGVLPNAVHYIKHLEEDDPKHDKLNVLMYMCYLTSEDFQRELA